MKESLHLVAEEIQQKGLPDFYDEYMQKDQAEINQILDPFLKEIRQTEIPDNPANPDYWANRAIEQYCQPGNIDRSILSFYLLYLLMVPPGIVIFQDIGVLFAYIHGLKVNVMDTV